MQFLRDLDPLPLFSHRKYKRHPSTFGFVYVLGMLSLFSIVQFPNQECTSESSATQKGTCVTSSECTTMTGTADGNCAAGFGVCCVVTSSTCGTVISTNITYIRNSGYPSSITPTSTGTCSFTVKKASDDVCQLREGYKIRLINQTQWIKLRIPIEEGG